MRHVTRVMTAKRRHLCACLALAWPLTASGCGASEAMQAAPVASLGQNAEVQEQWKRLEQVWRDGSDRERQGLESRLVQFTKTYPNDPETHRVCVWLAWLRLQAGKLDEALALCDQASVEKVGSTFDAAQVVRAAVLTRRGQPEASLRLLEPLSGKIIEGRERDEWAREIIRAALLLKHDDDALKWALVWRLDASEDRYAAIDREIGVVLDQVSLRALDLLWNQLVAADRIPTTLPGRKLGRVWMREAVLQRLAKHAIDSRDGDLARRLLNDAWLPLQKSTSLRRLTRVAARGGAELQSLTRSIGLVLELDDADGRRVSSELITGILQTLDERPGASVRLQTREARVNDREGYGEAVEDLYNAGVAVLVGGFREASAAELARHANAKGVAAIALAKLASSPSNGGAFWIDTSDQTVVELWKTGTSSNGGANKVVTDAEAGCHLQADEPVAEWQTPGLERALLNIGAVCADELSSSSPTGAHVTRIWLGPKALGTVEAWPSGLVKGGYQFASLLSASAQPQGLEAWKKRFSRLPSYYEVIGHDAALLAAAGLDGFPDSPGVEPGARAKILSDVAERLATAKVELWSTVRRGFDAKHGIVPEFALVSEGALEHSGVQRRRQ